jgi:hypothetical protein
MYIMNIRVTLDYIRIFSIPWVKDNKGKGLPLKDVNQAKKHMSTGRFEIGIHPVDIKDMNLARNYAGIQIL